MSDENFRPLVVWLILQGNPEEALELLAKHYGVSAPALKVGLPKKHKIKAYGCYTARNQTIYVQKSDALSNPFLILHEFYHHLRSKAVDRIHRGTERGADEFALSFLSECQKLLRATIGSGQ